MKRRDFLKMLSSVPFIGAGMAKACSQLPLSQDFPTFKKKYLHENRFYKPRWNVNGSWTLAENRKVLILHLNGPNHRFEKLYLNNLTTDELQKLHDDDHTGKIKRRFG